MQQLHINSQKLTLPLLIIGAVLVAIVCVFAAFISLAQADNSSGCSGINYFSCVTGGSTGSYVRADGRVGYLNDPTVGGTCSCRGCICGAYVQWTVDYYGEQENGTKKKVVIDTVVPYTYTTQRLAAARAVPPIPARRNTAEAEPSERTQQSSWIDWSTRRQETAEAPTPAARYIRTYTDPLLRGPLYRGRPAADDLRTSVIPVRRVETVRVDQYGNIVPETTAVPVSTQMQENVPAFRRAIDELRDRLTGRQSPQVTGIPADTPWLINGNTIVHSGLTLTPIPSSGRASEVSVQTLRPVTWTSVYTAQAPSRSVQGEYARDWYEASDPVVPRPQRSSALQMLDNAFNSDKPQDRPTSYVAPVPAGTPVLAPLESGNASPSSQPPLPRNDPRREVYNYDYGSPDFRPQASDPLRTDANPHAEPRAEPLQVVAPPPRPGNFVGDVVHMLIHGTGEIFQLE